MNVLPPQIPASSGPSAQSQHDISTKTNILIKKLEFDPSLATQDQGAVIRIYYKQYKAVLAAILGFEKLRKAGDWDGLFIPIHIDFIQLVTSKSMWYKQYKLFNQVSRYPQMIKWLMESEDVAADREIWGF